MFSQEKKSDDITNRNLTIVLRVCPWFILMISRRKIVNVRFWVIVHNFPDCGYLNLELGIDRFMN